MTEVDLFLSPEPKPDRFPVHECIITEAWHDEDTGLPDYDFELKHPEGCGGEECLVGMEFHEGGYLWEVLCEYRYPRELQTYPWITTYYVKGWTQTHDVPGMPIEYDAGIYVSLDRSELE